MGLAIASLVGGLIILIIGADGLVRGSTSLSFRLGLTPLVVGLTVVAFGTSSPELVVSLQATLNGQGGVAIGNVIGSNISNIALILGVAALISPLHVERRLIRYEIPLMIAISLVLVFFLRDGMIDRLEGGLFVAGLLTYLVASIYEARREKRQASNKPDASRPAPERSVALDVVFVIGGLALLVLGAKLFVDGAIAIAESLGVPPAVIAITMVALGTSLPELATSIVASVRKEGDVVVGNVIGSNLFNLLCILGIAALVLPMQSDGIRMTDLWVMVGTSVLTLPLMRTGFSINRWEGGLLLAGYIAYVVYLFVG